MLFLVGTPNGRNRIGHVDQRNDIRHFHNAVDQARRHRRRSAKRLVNAAEVIEHEVERQRVAVVLKLLEKAFVNRVNLRIDIRMVRFWRSTNDVLM